MTDTAETPVGKDTQEKKKKKKAKKQKAVESVQVLAQAALPQPASAAEDAADVQSAVKEQKAAKKQQTAAQPAAAQSAAKSAPVQQQAPAAPAQQPELSAVPKAKKEKLARIEIMCSQGTEEDFMELCRAKGVAKMFTKIPAVMGQGYSVPKMGDAIWPQLNSLYLVFCGAEEAAGIVEIVKEMRVKYPGEGCACFISKAKIG